LGSGIIRYMYVMDGQTLQTVGRTKATLIALFPTVWVITVNSLTEY